MDAAPVLRDACVLCTVGQVLEPADRSPAGVAGSTCRKIASSGCWQPSAPAIPEELQALGDCRDPCVAVL